MGQRLRIFISSPSDVAEERLRANLVVQKLARDYARFFQIEPYLWEHEPMLASGHFQDAIEPPSASDIVILIVYSRIGVPLPAQSTLREYRGIDGRSPVTGTEWEFEEALAAYRARGTPDLLAYRKLGDPGASLADPARRAEQERQWAALQSFWQRHFESGNIFLAGSAKFNSLEEFEQKLEADLVALIERRIAQGIAAPEGGPALWLKGSPFRGLAAYDFPDAPIFFGRDGAIRSALTRLQQAAQRDCAFLLLLGASGAGKSSVARAGILPALFAPKAIPGVGIWRRIVFRPGDGDDDPVLGLARALCAGGPDGDVGLKELVSASTGAAELAAHLASAADDASYPLRQALERIAAAERPRRGLLPHETARVVILIDQLEELFTRRIEADRRALFVRILAGLARSGCVWIVATMRSDLWHRAVELPQLVTLTEAGARLDLPAPDNAQIIEILRRSATAAGLRFEVEAESGLGLDAVMAHAAAEEPGVLPLLSVMLESLYQRDILERQDLGGQDLEGQDLERRDGAQPNLLRFTTYRALGELKGAIARRADAVLDALAASDPAAAQALPRVLRALVTIAAQGGGVTARPASLAAFAEGGAEARLIAALLAPRARLLIAAAANDAVEVRLAHEALIENWPRARAQIARDRRDLETRTRLEALLRRWSAAEGAERKRALLTGLNLVEGADLLQRWGDEASPALTEFVVASRNADRRRRRRGMAAAAALLCVFAAIAAVASLQWRRAEVHATAARQAQETERQARAAAEAERSRAVANEQRAAEALRATRRETAQTLAAQVQLALGQHDVRRALGLAVQAATIERGALGPGDLPASEPALLQALGQVREVAHIRGTSQRYFQPFTFLDDTTLLYAGAREGVTQLDLRGEAPRVTRIELGGEQPVNQLAAAPAAHSVALALGEELQLIDLATKSLKARIALSARINALDIDPAQRLVAATAGQRVALVELGSANLKWLAPPEVPGGVMAGQARFARSGTRLLVTFGAAIFEYEVASGTLLGQVGTLSGAGLGADQPTINAVLANGVVPFVQLAPDLGDSARLFSFAPLELQAIDPENHTARSLRAESSDFEFHGISAIDQERQGHATTLAAVLTRTRDNGQEFQLRYLSGRDGLILGTDQRLAPPFESFAIAPGDFANRKPDICKVSPRVTFLACQYWSKDTQGIVVWRVLAGTHGLERVADRYNASSVLFSGSGDLLVTTNEGLVALDDKGERKLAGLTGEWMLSSAQGNYLVATSAANGTALVLRRSDAGFEKTQHEIKGAKVLVVPGENRALAQYADRVALIDLTDGRTLWTVPIAGAQLVSPRGTQVVVAASNAAYLLDLASGRIVKSFPLTSAPDSPVAVDAEGGQLAYVDIEKKTFILDLATGEIRTVTDGADAATRLAWTRDATALLIGQRDGSVLAWRQGKRAWLVPSPFEKSFRASAWPGQPPQGVVLQIALSHDGRRFAIIRQDMPNIDIHETASGRLLTQLASPSTTLSVPARVAFGPNDEIVSSWAFHAMTRNKPRFVMLHRLPRNFEEALAAAQRRLEALEGRPRGTDPAH
jgi:outer membrane protein assembly factor BamB